MELVPHHLPKFRKSLAPLLAAPAALLLSQGQAKAVLTYNIFESGGNVIVRSSGSLTLPNSYDNFTINESGFWNDFNDAFGTGPASPEPNRIPAFKISGPTSIPGTTTFQPASSVSGLTAGIFAGPAYNAFFGSQFLLLKGYSGGEIFSEAVYSGKTLSNFGITASGLFGTWTLQPANQSDPYTANDTIQLIVSAPTPPSVAAPGPLPLFGAAAAFGWSRRLRKRIAAPLSTPPQA